MKMEEENSILNEKQEQRYTTKGISLGIFLAILCNCMFLTSSIMVKEYKLKSSEICFIRGILQMSSFLLIFISHRAKISKIFRSKKRDNKVQEITKAQTSEKSIDLGLCIVVCLCGLSFGTMTLLAYIGVKLLPLSDFVVFGQTAPVFTLILSAIILRQRISLLKAILCLTTAIGVLLVVQPTFIFKDVNSIPDAQLDRSNQTVIEQRISHKGPLKEYQKFSIHPRNLVSEVETPNQYIVGVVVGFATAFTAGLSLVLASKAKRCPNQVLMIVVGFSTFLVGILGPLFNLENRFLKSLDTWESSVEGISLTNDLLYTSGASLLSLLGVFVLIYASQVAPPTLVSTIRSCEILLALFVEKIVFGGFIGRGPEGKVQSMAWLSLGALLVLCSAVFMTLSDWIEKILCSFKSSNGFKNTKTEVINDRQIEDDNDAFILPSVQTTITTIGDCEDLKQPLHTVQEILERV